VNDDELVSTLPDVCHATVVLYIKIEHNIIGITSQK
jgi:hypothetical protein